MRFLFIYLAGISLLGILLTAKDKYAAQRGAWRVPERTLFTISILGGCPAVYLTMRLIHHKTLHKRFMWGLPAIFVLQIAAVLAVKHYLF